MSILRRGRDVQLQNGDFNRSEFPASLVAYRPRLARAPCGPPRSKDEVDHIVDDAMAFIRKAYPKDFPSYLERTMFRQEHAIGVVNLARLTGELSLLPLALLVCCQLGACILRGFEYSDGAHEELAPADLAMCLEAVPRLALAGAATIAGTPTLSPSSLKMTLFDSVIARLRLHSVQSAPSVLCGVLPGIGVPGKSVDSPIGGSCCSAASRTNGLNVDPGCFCTWP